MQPEQATVLQVLAVVVSFLLVVMVLSALIKLVGLVGTEAAEAEQVRVMVHPQEAMAVMVLLFSGFIHDNICTN